jgi:hypothetical protein
MMANGSEVGEDLSNLARMNDASSLHNFRLFVHWKIFYPSTFTL